MRILLRLVFVCAILGAPGPAGADDIGAVDHLFARAEPAMAVPGDAPARTGQAPRYEIILALKDVACVQATNQRKRQCDSRCETGYGIDCVRACGTAGVCVMGCQRSERQCLSSCISTHNAEVAACPDRT